MTFTVFPYARTQDRANVLVWVLGPALDFNYTPPARSEDGAQACVRTYKLHIAPWRHPRQSPRLHKCHGSSAVSDILYVRAPPLRAMASVDC
eukprot:5052840-Alexandrium_andersonii.AAC.1